MRFFPSSKYTQREVKIMSQGNKGNQCFGLILIIMPIIALIFGSDKPAMQTDNAAIVMTGMIFVGIILLASGNKKAPQTYGTAPAYQMSSTQPVSRSVSYCPHCGAEISIDDAQYCSFCGKDVHVSSSTQHHGFSG